MLLYTTDDMSSSRKGTKVGRSVAAMSPQTKEDAKKTMGARLFKQLEVQI